MPVSSATYVPFEKLHVGVSRRSHERRSAPGSATRSPCPKTQQFDPASPVQTHDDRAAKRRRADVFANGAPLALCRSSEDAMTRLVRHSLLAVLSLTAACAGTSAATRAAETASLSADDVDRIVAAYRDRREAPSQQLRSLDDVLEVLRRDQVDQFPEAVRFTAERSAEPRAAVLQAQLELSWGEAQRILIDLLGRSTTHLRQRALELEHKTQSGKLPPQELGTLARLRRSVEELGEVSEGLGRESTQHLADGFQLAQKLMVQLPNDYHGYRLAADYYRLAGDWPGFDDMMTKIAQLHPQSTGYLFLRGMEAVERYGDRGKAKRFLHQALAQDPHFARAQVQLLFLRGSIESAFVEYQALRAISPGHQLVTWLGPELERRHNEALAYKERRASREETQLLSR
jgi:hypothetical protein